MAERFHAIPLILVTIQSFISHRLKHKRFCYIFLKCPGGNEMERTRDFVLHEPVESAFERTAQILDNLGWKNIDQDEETYTQRWRIGGYWWFRRRFLTIRLNEIGDDRTEVSLSVRDPVLMWGGSNLVEDEADRLVEQLEGHLIPTTMPR
jgi:hypothetical protein